MSEPIYSATSQHHDLKVFYEPERHRFRLEFYPLDRPDEMVAASYCDAGYEPIFGIDAADMAMIFELAEVTEDDLLKLGR